MSNVDKDTGIWLLSIATKRHKCDFVLAAIIGYTYTPKSFIDVGCGDGRYCAIFKAYGWEDVVGLDGTEDIKSLGIYDRITKCDLTKPIYTETKAELVLCLEVGEHIPKEHEQVFLNNLCFFVEDELILSWAIPGQYSASGHVNCQPQEYVIKEIEKRGFKYCSTKSEYLKDCASFKWFKENLMIFKKVR